MKRAALLLMTALVAAGPSIAPVHTQVPAGDEARLLRFPAIHGNQVVFTYAGDLYTVPADGRRRAAPDERRRVRDVRPVLARREVARLHRPVRRQHRGLRHAGRGRRAEAPHLDGHARPRRRVGPHGPEQHRHRLEERRRRSCSGRGGPSGTTSAASSTWRPSTAGPSRSCPCRAAGSARFSPDGKQFVYNRVFREFRTWKRYRGGQADDVWLHDFTTKATTNLTNNPAQDIIPMWKGHKVYFASDRDERGRMNLYSYDLGIEADEEADELHRVRREVPVAGRRGHRLRERRLDLHSSIWRPRRSTKVPVHDRARTSTAAARSIVDVSRSITNYEIAPGRQPRAVRRARRRLHRAGEVRPHAQPDADARACTSATRSGRPTAGGSPTSPTPPARTRSGSRRRTGAAPPSRSPRAAATTSTSRSGRPTARS